MLTRRIIPCLDVKDGRVVKGTNFLALRDAGDPVEQAAAYDAQGADEICFLDIGAAPEGRDAIAWCAEVAARGAGEILLTSMDRDGTGAGYDLELVRAVAAAVPIPAIASGGVGELAHLAAGLEAGADAVLAASIFHFGQHTIGEAKAFLAARGLEIRG